VPKKKEKRQSGERGTGGTEHFLIREEKAEKQFNLLNLLHNKGKTATEETIDT